jgi:WD40 repeat protein
VDSGRPLSTVELPPDCRFHAIRASHAGRWLVLVNRTVRGAPLWLLDLSDGHSVEALPAALRWPTDCAFGPDDRWLLCAADGGTVRLSLPGLTAEAPTAASGQPPVLAPDGQASAAWDERGEALRVWDAESAPVASVPLPPGWAVWGLGLSDGGGVLAAYSLVASGAPRSPSSDVEVRCWETATGRELFRTAGVRLAELPFNLGRREAALSRDGRTLAVLCDVPDRPGAYRITLWDVVGGRVRTQLDLPSGAAGWKYGCDLLSPDGRVAVLPLRRMSFLAQARELAVRLGVRWPFAGPVSERGAALFDATTGRSLGGVTGGIEAAAWSPDGSLLAVLDEEGKSMRVWDVPPRKALWWFAAGATLLALPVALLARRRVRRLRAAAG